MSKSHQKVVVLSPALDRVHTEYPSLKEYKRNSTTVESAFPNARIFIEVPKRLVSSGPSPVLVKKGGSNA